MVTLLSHRGGGSEDMAGDESSIVAAAKDVKIAAKACREEQDETKKDALLESYQAACVTLRRLKLTNTDRIRLYEYDNQKGINLSDPIANPNQVTPFDLSALIKMKRRPTPDDSWKGQCPDFTGVQLEEKDDPLNLQGVDDTNDGEFSKWMFEHLPSYARLHASVNQDFDDWWKDNRSNFCSQLRANKPRNLDPMASSDRSQLRATQAIKPRPIEPIKLQHIELIEPNGE